LDQGADLRAANDFQKLPGLGHELAPGRLVQPDDANPLADRDDGFLDLVNSGIEDEGSREEDEDRHDEGARRCRRRSVAGQGKVIPPGDRQVERQPRQNASFHSSSQEI